jgi:hypothetical protein
MDGIVRGALKTARRCDQFHSTTACDATDSRSLEIYPVPTWSWFRASPHFGNPFGNGRDGSQDLMQSADRRDGGGSGLASMFMNNP